MLKMDLEKAEEPEIKLPTYVGLSKKHENSRKTSTSASLTMLKPLIITTNWKILQDGNTGLPYLPPGNLYAGQEATVRTGHGTRDWFNKGKEYIKAVYCHPAYFLFNIYAEYIM